MDTAANNRIGNPQQTNRLLARKRCEKRERICRTYQYHSSRMDRIKRKKTQEFKRLKISKPKKAHERSWIFLRICRIISRQLAETEKAVGLQQNAVANKKGGAVAKNARKELEAKTGKIVITGENFFTTKKIMVNCKNKRKPN